MLSNRYLAITLTMGGESISNGGWVITNQKQLQSFTFLGSENVADLTKQAFNILHGSVDKRLVMLRSHQTEIRKTSRKVNTTQ